MNITSIFLIGIGLSMDAFAVSVAKGMCLAKEDVRKSALKLAIYFGFFQGLMPFIGWWVGSYFQELISSVDHWIAFILLGVIGGKMIYDAFHPETTECVPLTNKLVFLLAIATSIDALAVGVSFAFLNVDILSAVAIIGITTFVLSFIATFLGNRLGCFLQKYAELLGGSILIIIGLKILVEHLLA
ncbi:MAG: manganese efflux pump MntP family protein [Longicatena sp.]